MELQSRAREVLTCVPNCVAAAGMITSPLGLAELPHVPAPAGLGEISAAVQWVEFLEITDLPFLLVPGVRCGPEAVNLDSINQRDVMRGEETLCVGLKALGLLELPCVVLNLGSHWKAIRLDREGRIQTSSTSLSGELLHSVQSQTVLASAVPRDRPARIDWKWLEAGMNEQRRSGLSRAMFCVRLLELSHEGTPEQRFSFLLGAFIAGDLDTLVVRGLFESDTQVAICGNQGMTAAWQEVLTRMSMPARVLTDDETERAFLSGLRCILQQADRH